MKREYYIFIPLIMSWTVAQIFPHFVLLLLFQKVAWLILILKAP